MLRAWLVAIVVVLTVLVAVYVLGVAVVVCEDGAVLCERRKCTSNTTLTIANGLSRVAASRAAGDLHTTTKSKHQHANNKQQQLHRGVRPRC